MPTRAELTKLYGGLAAQALREGTAKPIKGPPVKDPNKYASYDVTPKGLQDVTKTVYVIKGTIYHRQSGMGPDGPVSVWNKIGKAPIF